MSDAWDQALASPGGRASRKRNTPAPVNLDRLPPHSLEAEQGILSCLLQAENLDVLNEAEERGFNEHWFYDLRHQLIWSAMAALHTAGTAVDVITTQQWLKDRDQLEQVGGLAYLAALPDLVPGTSSAPYYFGILREQSLLREVIKAGTEAVAGAYSIVQGEKTDPEVLVARLERSITKLSEASSTVAEVQVGLVVAQLMPDIEDYHRGRAQIRGLTTGLDYFDKLTCGLGGRNGNFVVLSGRPSTGKTSLALQIALHAALDFVWWQPVFAQRAPGLPPAPELDAEGKPKFTRQVGIPVGIFSYEMATPALVERMLFTRSQVDMQRWRTGFAESYGAAELLSASHQLASAKIWIDDKPGPVESLRARARRMFRQHGIRCFIVDYFQLMTAANKREYRGDRVQELTEVSRQLRELGKELNVPFIVLAQMNRDYEKDPTRPPRLADLKDCGAIEQDADLVGFLYRPKLKENAKAQYEAAMDKVFPEGDWSARPERVNMLVAKNRYGPTGKAELLFQKSCTRFHDWIAWLKSHGQKELAAGESKKAVQAGEQRPAAPAEDNEEKDPSWLE